MSRLEVMRPASLAAALAAATPEPLVGVSGSGAGGSGDSGDSGEGGEGGRFWLAGGQSLLAAMRLGMASPSVLIDLQDIPGLRDIRLEPAAGAGSALWIGAMATHASVAVSDVVRRFSPGLARLAGGIADAQVRQMGTIGGSLAHNDPAACWPAGVLAAGATIVTSQREIAADDYFVGLYTTALAPGELIVGVRFAPLSDFHYLKFEQPASRFALVGVAVARRKDEAAPDRAAAAVRVAVTGLGEGVVRWALAEQALQSDFSAGVLEKFTAGASTGLHALSDLHASAEYREHLAGVLVRRGVAAMGGGVLPTPAPLAPRASSAGRGLGGTSGSTQSAAPGTVSPAAPAREGFGGVQLLAASPTQVWQTLLDPRHLQASIPGCESLVQTSPETYEATVKVGLGPLSVRFKTGVLLRDQRPPQSLTLIFQGNAGALGSGQGTSQVRFEVADAGHTRLHWWVQVQLSGRLAQFGNRLVEATARKLSGEFFDRIALALGDGQPATDATAGAPWWRRLLQSLFSFLRK